MKTQSNAHLYDYTKTLQDKIQELYELELHHSRIAGKTNDASERLDNDQKAYQLCCKRQGVAAALDLFVDQNKGKF